MLKLIRRVSSDDSTVKLLFDHVRNVGICAVVFGAAAWQYKNLEPEGYTYFFQTLIIGLLVVFGLFLFLVNQFHGMARLRLSDYPGWVLPLIMHTYSLVIVTIVVSIVGVRLS